jgi:hypothetical protein
LTISSIDAMRLNNRLHFLPKPVLRNSREGIAQVCIESQSRLVRSRIRPEGLNKPDEFVVVEAADASKGLIDVLVLHESDRSFFLRLPPPPVQFVARPMVTRFWRAEH